MVTEADVILQLMLEQGWARSFHQSGCHGYGAAPGIDRALSQSRTSVSNPGRKSAALRVPAVACPTGPLGSRAGVSERVSATTLCRNYPAGSEQLPPKIRADLPTGPPDLCGKEDVQTYTHGCKIPRRWALNCATPHFAGVGSNRKPARSAPEAGAGAGVGPGWSTELNTPAASLRSTFPENYIYPSVFVLDIHPRHSLPRCSNLRPKLIKKSVMACAQKTGDHGYFSIDHG